MHSPSPLSKPLAAPNRPRAFTLVELMVVMGVILLIIGLGIPAFNGIKGGKDITTTAYDIAGTLEQARAYAMANRTYVWVGFFEEDGSTVSAKPATPGIGRVVMCVVASKDGARYKDTKVDTSNPTAFGADTSTTSNNSVKLVQLNKLIKLEGTHLTAANIGRGGSATSPVNVPDRPIVDADYQVGDPSDVTTPNAGPFSKHYYTNYAGGGGGAPTLTANPTTFGYPVGTTGGTSQYTFAKIIEFNPQGEACKIVDGIASGNPAWMEIAVVPARGKVVDPRYLAKSNDPNDKAPKSAAAVQVGGLNGRVRIFRP